MSRERFLRTLAAVLERGVDFVRLRAAELGKPDYIALAGAVIGICRRPKQASC